MVCDGWYLRGSKTNKEGWLALPETNPAAQLLSSSDVLLSPESDHRLAESLIEVGDQIVLTLDANRDAQQSRRDTDACRLFQRHVMQKIGSWMHGQSLYSTQTGRACCQ